MKPQEAQKERFWTQEVIATIETAAQLLCAAKNKMKGL